MNEASVTAQMEGAIIGALIGAPEAFPVVAGKLQPEYFTEPHHQAIYRAILERHDSGQLCDARTLATDLHSGWNDQFHGGSTFGKYLAALMREAAPLMMLPGYAADLRACWALRALHDAADESKSADGMPASRLEAALASIDEMRAALVDVSGTREAAWMTAANLLHKVNDRLIGGVCPLGASTGWHALDDVMGGYIGGQLIIIAGRPGMGKTTLATSSSVACAAAGSGVFYFSLEMGQDDMGARLLADISYNGRLGGIPYSAIKAAAIGESQMARLIEARSRLADLPLEFDYAARLSVSEIGVRIKAAKKRFARLGADLRVCFVDYLKMVKASDRYRGNRVYEVGEITAGLREVARREGVCIVLLCQLNRGVEGEAGNKRPMLQHLRESGDIEADADVVLFVYRHAYYLSQTTKYLDGAPEVLAEYDDVKNKMEVIAAKNRNGATVTTDLFVNISASAVRSLGERGHA